MIQIVPGSRLWYRPTGAAGPFHPAVIAFVNPDDTLNIGFLNTQGQHQNAVNVALLQPGGAPPAGAYCELRLDVQEEAVVKEQAQDAGESAVEILEAKEVREGEDRVKAQDEKPTEGAEPKDKADKDKT